MSDGWMGWDGLSYTTVTPRASLKSDANNKLHTWIKNNFLLNLLRFARLPEVCVWCPPPIVRDLGKSTEEEKNDPIFWKSTWIVSSDFKIHQLTQRFNVKTILFSFLCNFLHFRKRAHWQLVLINKGQVLIRFISKRVW